MHSENIRLVAEARGEVMEARDYANRTYLSAIEAARFLGVSVRMVHRLTAEGLSLASPPKRNRRIYRIETHWLFGGKPAIALNLRLLQVKFHPFVELPKGLPFAAD